MPSAIEDFLADIQALPPAAQAQLKQKFFQKYVMPSDEWQSGGLSGRIELTKQLGIPDVAGGPEIKSAPGFLGRVQGRAGYTGEPAEKGDWGGALGNVLALSRLPFAAGGEAIDTALDPLRSKGRPLPPGGNAGMLTGLPDRSTGELAEFATMFPQVFRRLIAIPGALNRYLDVLNKRVTAPSPPGAMPRPPLMLPPAGGSTRNPFVLPGGFTKPTPPPYSRPPSTMPRFSQPAPEIQDLLKPPGPID